MPTVTCVVVCMLCAAPLSSSCLFTTDKNPVLKEFATEVTKIINEAVSRLEGGRG